MSSSSEGVARLDVAVLKSPDFASWSRRYGGGTQLPYRMDHLEKDGIALHFTDAHLRPPWNAGIRARAFRGIESLTAPALQAWMLRRDIARSPVTLAMFESEGNTVAALRRLGLFGASKGLVVVSCWLADVLPGMSARRRAVYRHAYRSVGRIVVFSSNQRPLLAELLGVPENIVRFVPFGVDEEFFRPIPGAEGDCVLAVGRDRGRDWPTFFAAAALLDARVLVASRARDVAGLDVPPNVELLGYVDRHRYRDLLSRARVVVVPSRETGYPSGQSVLLEAWAMGKPVVATGTRAMSDYLDDGVNVLAVPAGDPAALAGAVEKSLGDPQLSGALGAGGRRAVEDRCSAARMWHDVAGILGEAARHQ